MDFKQQYLTFNADIGKKKPETIIHSDHSCPFCDRNNLKNIIAQDGPILLVENKYPVLQDTYQTVLIECEECDSELSLYSKEHLHRVIRFGIKQWQMMINSRQFASVIYYKNHGPFSGGTIRHPHMQIVGLKYINYTANIVPHTLEGSIIAEQHGVQLNLSEQPKIGFCEFNIKLEDWCQIDCMAEYIQFVAHYLLNHFHKNCKSYNLFFYQMDGWIAAKMMPRFVTSPLFVGYSIPQVSSRLSEVTREMRKLYF
jgi:galactose-1-phosphate uridylyltransferase